MVTPREFRQLLGRLPPEEIVRDYLFQGTPFAFAANPAHYDLLLRTLSQSLKIPKADLSLVGSGRVGFSLSPYKFGTAFNAGSDLDIVVVSRSLFDRVWLDIYRSRIPDDKLHPAVAAARAEHRGMVFYGRIVPHKLYRITPTAGRWKRAFASVGRYPELSQHLAKGMLFRSWEHAAGYYVHGLRKVKGL